MALPSVCVASDLYSVCLSLQNKHPLNTAEKAELAKPDLNSRLEKSLISNTNLRDSLCIIAETKRIPLLKGVLNIKKANLIPEVFNTVISLQTPQNSDEIAHAALDWLKDPDQESQILRVAGALEILEALSKLPEPELLEKHFTSDIPEIRVSAYSFFFRHYEKYPRAMRQDRFKTAILADPLQVRALAYLTYKSLDESEQMELKAFIKNCSKDKASEVRETCP